MQTIEHRRFIRHPLRLPLAFVIIKSADKMDQQEMRSETINVSLGGLLFPSEKSVLPESIILIKMPIENKVFNVRAKVVRCVKIPKKKLYDIAVRFSRPQEAFKVKMIEQISLIAQYRESVIKQSGKDISMEEASRQWIQKYSERFSRLYW
ncbi:MAG: PilZ domain-containing protein [Candidatus Omnitrophica bacterium]|nr:PilZ domain-containing protein [Candidatus Omnitrophota bacterium]